MNFVLDASVALSWCFEDEGGEYADDVLESLRASEAIVASHWALEVTNGLLTAERRGRIAERTAASMMRLITALPIVIDPVTRRRAFESSYAFARRHRITSYDAAYLELASRMALPLATLDTRLRASAADDGVPIYLA